MRKTLAVIATIMSIVGCSDGPRDRVIDSAPLVVYAAKECEPSGRGKYEYFIRDNSTKGWSLITDQKFAVGDTLQIVKVGE